MENLLVVVLCLLVGLALRWVRAFPAAAAVPVLNAYAIYVALPALVLRQIAALRVSGDIVLPLLVPWLVLALSAGLVLLIARLRGWSREVTGALLLVVPLGNTAFIGLPLVGALLGPAALPFAVLYDQVGSFLALTLYGTAIASVYAPAPQTADPRPRAGALLAQVIVFPPFLALLLGLAAALLLPDGLPPIIDKALSGIAASLVPTVLVAVGLAWRLTLPSSVGEPFALALIIKLVIAPLAAWGIVALLQGSGPAADASILQAAMGPMVTAGALATARGMAPELVAAIVGYGTLISLGSVTALHALLSL